MRGICLLTREQLSSQKGPCSVLLINPLNAELNPTRHLLALVGARHIVHVSRIRVNTRRYQVPSRVLCVRYEQLTFMYCMKSRVKVEAPV